MIVAFPKYFNLQFSIITKEHKYRLHKRQVTGRVAAAIRHLQCNEDKYILNVSQQSKCRSQ